MIRIVEPHGVLLEQAEALAKRVFPNQDFGEHTCFWAYARQDDPAVRDAQRQFGVEEFLHFSVAVTEFEEVVGVCGLYTTPDTQHDSVWLNWLCVDPNYRKQGIRRMLLETAIKQAKATGKKFLCLFTSDDPNEAAAQKLYEKYGLKIVRKEKDSTHMTFYRTLRLY